MGMVPYSDTLELYHFRSCPHSTTVRWGLSHKKVPHRLEDAPLLFRKKLRELSDQTWPPVLTHKGRAYVHQQACTHYLEQEFPDTPLIPSDPVQYADYFIVSHWIDRALHYLMVAIKYLNRENFEFSKQSILKDRQVTLFDRFLVELSPRVQAKHLVHQDYVASELPEIQRIVSECWHAIDVRLRAHDFVAGPSLTYVDIQLYANLKTISGCVEAREIDTLTHFSKWRRRIEENYDWPHT